MKKLCAALCLISLLLAGCTAPGQEQPGSSQVQDGGNDTSTLTLDEAEKTALLESAEMLTEAITFSTIGFSTELDPATNQLVYPSDEDPHAADQFVYLLSGDYETKVRINKREFLECIDRATLLTREGDRKPIVINISDEGMTLRIDSALGSMNEDIEIEKQGKDLMIGFNPKFLIDALRVIDDEEVDLYMVNPKAPCFIKNEEESYIYLILPVSLVANYSR